MNKFAHLLLNSSFVIVISLTVCSCKPSRETSETDRQANRRSSCRECNTEVLTALSAIKEWYNNEILNNKDGNIPPAPRESVEYLLNCGYYISFSVVGIGVTRENHHEFIVVIKDACPNNHLLHVVYAGSGRSDSDLGIYGAGTLEEVRDLLRALSVSGRLSECARIVFDANVYLLSIDRQ